MYKIRETLARLFLTFFDDPLMSTIQIKVVFTNHEQYADYTPVNCKYLCRNEAKIFMTRNRPSKKIITDRSLERA